ncbi:MAG: M56 family metallopeptidase [Clostridiaceae bacterium]|nr:M56 family metallopeptidase [Clostridiaceae bacterium]
MTLLKMSLSGAVLVCVVAIVRALAIHRLPKRALLALWWMALARLLLPVSLPSPVSVYTLLEVRDYVVSETYVAPAPALPAAPEALPAVSQGNAVSSPGALAPSPGAVARLQLVWAVGSVGCALFFALASVRCRREFRTSLPVADRAVQEWLAGHPLRRPVEVRTSDRISAPLTYGILRPVILLPEGFDCGDAAQLGYVLTHEWVHIRRFDGLAKLLIAAAACLHWWNPFAWALSALFNRDLELACDEEVVRRHGVASRAAYARALITLEERKSGLAPFCSSFNHNAMEERIVAIMKIRNLSTRAAALSAATVFAVGALFATSAAVGVPSQTAHALTSTGSGESFPAYAPVERVDWKEERELLESFEKFGISYDSDGKIYFHGERVRWFWDGYEIWEDGSLLGWSMRYEYLDRDGTVDVHTLHECIDNGDGSLDYYGPLKDIVAYSQQEFDSRTYESIRKTAEATAIDDDAVLVEDPARPGSGYAVQTVYDETVHASAEDAVGEVAEETSYEVQANYSEKVGVVTDDTVEDAAEGTGAAAVADGNGGAAGGRTLEEIFAAYEDYGVTYREQDGIREVFYHGEPVAHFVDSTPGGSVFSFSPTGGAPGTISVRTVYGSDGKLAGVEPFVQPER